MIKTKREEKAISGIEQTEEALITQADGNIPFDPFVTTLQLTALGCTALSSSRKKMPSDKLLSCKIEIVINPILPFMTTSRSLLHKSI